MMHPLSEIINTISPYKIIGEQKINVTEIIIASIENENRNALMWVGSKKNHLLKNITKGIIICEQILDQCHENCTYLIVKNPRWAFLMILKKFFKQKQPIGISNSAIIHPSAKLGSDIFIGENVVIEKDSIIGDHVIIDHNTIIKADSVISDNCKIGSNCVIGGVGFGYEKGPGGKYELIPHIGNVVLEENVEIGNNTTIDRAVLGSTFLRKNVKVDNLVHIAHGVDIGRNSLVIANSMIAGSVTVGENVWIAPSSSILNGKTIENEALIGLGAVVLKNVKSKEIIVGNPGKPLNK